MADNQAKRWTARPVLARLVRIAIVVVPFVSAMVVAYWLSAMLPIGTSLEARLVRWVGIAVAATTVLLVVDRSARRLLPLSTLLKLTLVFPDQAPSRFKVAMRTGTTRQLKERIARARTVDPNETPAEAAERLLELVALLSHHDRLTRGHCERVRAYSHLIGDEMNLTRVELDKLRWAGLLHDVGKIAVPFEILNKPGTLTDEEFDVIKTHPDEGRALVAPLADWLGESVRAVWEHHERFDGNGYPQGLSGANISFAARVVAVADAYDVMTSARSYKAPMSAESARAELARCSGTQFDPVVVRALLNVSIGRLKIMMGPLAFLAQWSIFGQAGVVHAGSASGSTSGTLGSSTAATASTGGAAGSAVASSGAAAAGSAAAAGGLGSAATTLAVAAGVAAGAAGMAAAPPAVVEVDPPPIAIAEERVELTVSDDVLVENSAFQQALAEELSAPGSVIEAPLPGGVAGDSDEVITTTGHPESDPTSTEPAPSSPPNSAQAPATTVATTTTTPTLPVTVATTSPPSSTSSSTTTTTTTTTTTSSTTTTTTTAPPVQGIDPRMLGTIHLASVGSGDTTSQPVLPLTVDVPLPVPLPNYDTDRNDDPGLTIGRDSAGLNGNDPNKIQRFSVDVGVDGELDGDARVRLYVAAKDFERTDVHVVAGLFRCDGGGACTPLAIGDKWVNQADRFKSVTIPIGDVEQELVAGDRLELRVAVLDTAGDAAWFAYGTAEFPAHLEVSPD